ncbi:hypothetical protein BDV30DRAFT_236514 [Aspergillus minisclerotigenes]|uniref:Uncharacterized protein n=1 Tax=Aspergillus minisclerotigenes TaxID=656917 RepID=A0A5N6JB51_9EURO|nr:hypothetical protein BDV30DRAFT_236514 [Aspergillus minisclerotigenes]
MPSSSRPQEKSVSRLIERLCSCKTELITVERCQKMKIEGAPIALEDMAAPELRPYYFRATPSEFMEQHPIKERYMQGLMKESPHPLTLREYDPEVASKSPTATLAERIAADSASRVGQVTDILSYYIDHVVRDSMPFGYAMGQVRGWSYACDSNINPLAKVYSAPTDLIAYNKHRTVMIYEVDNHRLPHVTMAMQHSTHQEADKEALYVHELVALLRAMSIRYTQPEFEQYQVIPVLLLSFMTPQNGRILEAYLHGRKPYCPKKSTLLFQDQQRRPVRPFFSLVTRRSCGNGVCHGKPPSLPESLTGKLS